jgi:hypothetical protein
MLRPLAHQTASFISLEFFSTVVVARQWHQLALTLMVGIVGIPHVVKQDEHVAVGALKMVSDALNLLQ